MEETTMRNEIFIKKNDEDITMEEMLVLLKGKKGVVRLKNDLKELENRGSTIGLNYELPELELYRHYNIGEYNIDVYMETVTCDGDIAVGVDIYDID